MRGREKRSSRILEQERESQLNKCFVVSVYVLSPISLSSSILSCLDSEGLLISGLATHHVLFCATLKGKASIYRHLEPHLLMDDDWQTVQEMKKYVDQAVFVGGGTENKGVKEGVHCVGRLEEFFL